MTETIRCQIVKLAPEFAIVKLPDSGNLVYAPKKTFLEISVDLNGDTDLSLLFSVGKFVSVRSIFELQKPAQGCKLIAEEWGEDGETKTDKMSEKYENLMRENVETDSISSTIPNGQRERVVGFVNDIMPTYVIVYGLHRGFVFCGKPSFDHPAFWDSVDVGVWVVMETEKQTERQGCHWKANRISPMGGAPPVNLWKNPIYGTWSTRVRCLVGAMQRNFGSAWSPQIGRIHICQKHLANIHSLEDRELEVYLHPDLYHSGNHWLTTGRLGPKLSDNPWGFIYWCPAVKLVRASVRIVKETGCGFMQILENGLDGGKSHGEKEMMERAGSGGMSQNNEGIFFASEDLIASKHGGKNIKDFFKVGSEWDVFVHPQEGPINDRGRNPFRALAVLPLGTVALPNKPLCGQQGTAMPMGGIHARQPIKTESNMSPQPPMVVDGHSSSKYSQSTMTENLNQGISQDAVNYEKKPLLNPKFELPILIDSKSDNKQENKLNGSQPVVNKVNGGQSVVNNVNKVAMKDESCQTEDSVEVKLMKIACRDSELFSAIAIKYPDLIREMVVG